MRAKHRHQSIFVGVDCFGRGCRGNFYLGNSVTQEGINVIWQTRLIICESIIQHLFNCKCALQIGLHPSLTSFLN